MAGFNMYPALEIGRYTQNRQRLGMEQQRIDLAERGMGYEGERIDIAREGMGMKQEDSQQKRTMELIGRAATHLRGIEDPVQRAAAFDYHSNMLGQSNVDISKYRDQALGADGNAFLESAIAASTKRTKPGVGTTDMQNYGAAQKDKGFAAYLESKKGPASGKSTTAIKEYQYAVANDGYKGSFTKWKKDNKSASSVNVSVGMPGVSKSDISKETLRTVKAASGLAAASDLVKQYRTMGEGVAGVRGKIGELGGAISATGVPGVKEFGETVTKRATGVSQRELSDLRRSGRAFIAQNVPEITAEDSGRVTKEELRITGEADKILEASSSYDEIIGALQAAVSAKYTAYHKSQYIRTGKPKFNLVAGEETQQRSEQLRFVEELLALDPDMDREVAARALQRMMTFQKLEELDK